MEKIAVVGPRRGADKATVVSFVTNLYAQHPDAILVSGGAEGVDTWAESTWMKLGGTVWSYRARKKAPDCFAVEKWEIGQGRSRVYELINEPTWADWGSALLYRSMIVAGEVDRVVSFHGSTKMRGTEFTEWVAKEAEQKPTYVYADDQWSLYNT